MLLPISRDHLYLACWPRVPTKIPNAEEDRGLFDRGPLILKLVENRAQINNSVEPCYKVREAYPNPCYFLFIRVVLLVISRNHATKDIRITMRAMASRLVSYIMNYA